MSENVFQSPTPAAESEPRQFKSAPPNYVGVDPNMQFPPKGVPVYVDHPFFERDELFAAALTALVLARHVAVKTGHDKSVTDEMLSWLQGDIPMPEDVLEMVIRNRAEQAKIEGLDIEPARAPELVESA